MVFVVAFSSFQDMVLRVVDAPVRATYLDVFDLNGKLATTLTCGYFEMSSYEELAEGVPAPPTTKRLLQFKVVSGDVSLLTADADNHGATFQVASQFNCLETTDWSHNPYELGVSGYAFDYTQGPTAAICVGGGTLLRQYFLDTKNGPRCRPHPLQNPLREAGRRNVQLNGFSAMQAHLTGLGFGDVLVQNGYLIVQTVHTLRSIDSHFRTLGTGPRTDFMRLLRVGVLTNAAPTSLQRGQTLVEAEHVVNQVYCASVPISYQNLPKDAWKELATLITQSAFDCTLRAAARNAGAHPDRVGAKKVFLTLIGNGAFDVPEEWVYEALRESLRESLIYLVSFFLSSSRYLRFLLFFCSLLHRTRVFLPFPCRFQSDSGAHLHFDLDVKLVMYRSSLSQNQHLEATILEGLSS